MLVGVWRTLAFMGPSDLSGVGVGSTGAPQGVIA